MTSLYLCVPGIEDGTDSCIIRISDLRQIQGTRWARTDVKVNKIFLSCTIYASCITRDCTDHRFAASKCKLPSVLLRHLRTRIRTPNENQNGRMHRTNSADFSHSSLPSRLCLSWRTFSYFFPTVGNTLHTLVQTTPPSNQEKWLAHCFEHYQRYWLDVSRTIKMARNPTDSSRPRQFGEGSGPVERINMIMVASSKATHVSNSKDSAQNLQDPKTLLAKHNAGQNAPDNKILHRAPNPSGYNK